MAAVRVNGKRASLAKFSGRDVTNEFAVAPAGVASGDHSMGRVFEWRIGGRNLTVSYAAEKSRRNASGTVRGLALRFAVR